MAHTHRFAAILTLLLIITPALAAAQTSTPVPPPPEKKWSLVRGFTVGGSDQAPAIEAAMRAAGLDDTSPGFFGGPIGYPFSSRIDAGSETDLTYRHNRRLALGLRRTSVGLGSTNGHQAVPSAPFFGRYLRVQSDATTFAAIGYFRINRALRVGAGPVTASTQVSDDPSPSSSRGPQSFKSRVYGGLVTATLEGDIFRYVSLGFTVSRMWIPEVAVGPFTTSSGDSIDAMYGTASLPAMRVNLSHQTYGLSLGIRF